jgi:hypothetical protein
MKRRKRRSKRMKVMHLWDGSEVAKAVPYLRSVLASLREHWLDVLNAQRRLDLAAPLKKPAKCQQILAEESRKDERQRAQDRFEDALKELNGIDVFLLDPVLGLALIPFRKGDELAWFIFEQFAPHGVIGWRNHDDPIEECRPLNLLQEAAVGEPVPN